MIKSVIAFAWFIGTVIVGNVLGAWLLGILASENMGMYVAGVILTVFAVLGWWRGSIYLLRLVAAKLERSNPP